MNISGLTPVDDPSYRYKMPRIQGKVEGRGNGIKTVLVNIVEVAQSLNRESPEITKFFGTEFGAQTTYNDETDRAVVNGAHNDVDLQKKMHIYIEKFVLCATCKLPETHYKLKDGIINQKCLACGSKSTCDMSHKLTTFILAQYKKAKAEAKKNEGSDKKNKKDKKDKKDTTDSAEQAKESSSSKKDKKEKKSKKNKNDDGKPTSIFNMEGGDDKSGKADAESGKGEDADDNDAKALDDACTRFAQWIENNDISQVKDVMEELRALQTMASLKPSDRLLIFIGTVMTEGILDDDAKEISTHKEVIAALGVTDIQQRHVISAFEWLCGVHISKLATKFPLLLHALFDEELIEEEVFLMWSTDYARSEYSVSESLIDIDVLESLKGYAAPFITWLKEAESESESGEED